MAVKFKCAFSKLRWTLFLRSKLKNWKGKNIKNQLEKEKLISFVWQHHTHMRNEIRYVSTVPKPNGVNDDWQTASLLAAANTHEVRVLPCSRLRQQSPEGSCYIRILSPQLNMARVISPSLSLWINCKCNWKHRERDGRAQPSDCLKALLLLRSAIARLSSNLVAR